jgi:hypothetical protein
LPDFRVLLSEAFARTGKPVRLIGVGVRFASLLEKDEMQLNLLRLVAAAYEAQE